MAREEKDNKVSLLGVYPDGKLQVPRVPAAFALSFVFFLLDGEGLFGGTFEIRQPSSQMTPFHDAIAKIEKRPGEVASIIINFAPFVAFAFGRFMVILTIEGQRYEREFEVVEVRES